MSNENAEISAQSEADRETLRTCANRLQSTDWLTRHEAAQQLAELGEQALAPAIEALQNSRPEVRTEAIRILQTIGEPAVKPLMNLLTNELADRRKAIAIAFSNGADPLAERRDAAISALAGISSSSTAEALPNLLREEIVAARRLKRIWWINKAVRLMVLIAIALLPILGHSNPSILWWYVFLILVSGFTDMAASRRRTVANSLAKHNDTRMIGALALCLTDTDREVRLAASAALIGLLPRVQAHDRQHLRPVEMEALIEELGHRNASLTLAILKALEQIGDERALATVERLAEPDEGCYHFYNQDHIEESIRAARECLPFLRQRSEEAQQAQTLLRASTPSLDRTSENLLRPAQDTSSIASEELLRPMG